jgi:nifR3 family TIM-barrel protein
VAAARRVQGLASVIDLNFSGPMRRIVTQGYGAACLRNPGLIKEIVTAVAGSVRLPVTAKIRIGFDGPDVDCIGIAQICQDAGAAAVAVHARFVHQGYAGPACWDRIRRVKQNVDIPVIGNGAVHGPADVQAMIEQTGCDFVMIGTAAFVNPLIFRQSNEFLETGRCHDVSQGRALLEFFRHYHTFARRVESQGTLHFLRRSCRDFLRARAYLQRIQTGQATLE